MKRTIRKKMLVLAVASAVALGAGAALGKGPPNGGGGGHTETQGNNLSFPALALDNFAIADVLEAFSVPYTGTYPGLTPEQIAALGEDDWYPQKTEGNSWNADFVPLSAVDVDWVDWGDNIESSLPKMRRPFRLEVVLFKSLSPATMSAYRMAVLEYPSSSNELQGTNGVTYQSGWATVVSSQPKLVIQNCGESIPEDLDWNGARWVSAGDPSACTNVPIVFAPELNVGGKYIFGASQGGWKPTEAGWYRITFYSPEGSGVSLATAQVGNYADFAGLPAPETAELGHYWVLAGARAPESAEIAVESEEGGGATPVVDAEHNLSYADVQVVGGGGGGKGSR